MTVQKKKPEESTGETEKIESTTQEDTMPKQVRSKGGISAWERVLLSRKTDRPVGTDYVNMLFSDFMEFHGDRLFRDDPAVAGGIAMFGNIPVTVIAQVKGKTTKENVTRNFSDDVSGRISENITIDPAGRKVRTSGDLYRRYSGSILRTGSRRARTGRSDRFKLI